MLAVAAGLGFVALTLVVVTATDMVTQFDRTVNEEATGWAAASQWLVDVCLFLKAIGGVGLSSLLVVIVATALLVWGRFGVPLSTPTLMAIFLVLNAAGGALLNTIVKNLVSRQRPETNGTWVFEESLSYPSGHAQSGISVWVVLGLISLVLIVGWTRWLVGISLILVGFAIGISRVIIGVHWPTDVIGGWLLGLSWLGITLLLMTQISRPRTRTDAVD